MFNMEKLHPTLLLIFLFCIIHYSIAQIITTTGITKKPRTENLQDIAKKETLQKQTGIVKTYVVPNIFEENNYSNDDLNNIFKSENIKKDSAYKPTTGVQSLIPITSFEAIKKNDNVIPPDPSGAIGPRHVVTLSNSQIKIQDKSGNTLCIISNENFWKNFGDQNAADPHTLYDPYSNRWIIIAQSKTTISTSHLLIGVSQTEDPTQNWYKYIIDVDSMDNQWLDFPLVAFNKDWIVVTGNMILNSSSTPQGSIIFTFNKSNLYNGIKARYTQFSIPITNGYNICPAITYNNTLPYIYLASTYGYNTYYNDSLKSFTGRLQLFKISGSIGKESFASVGFFDFSGPWENSAPIKTGGPQSGTSNSIFLDDDRIKSLVFRNGSLWGTQAIFLPCHSCSAQPWIDRSAIQWFEVDPLNKIVKQINRIDDPSAENWYAFPSIGVNGRNDILLGYSKFSSNQFASAAYSFRYGTDPPGTMRNEYIFKAGETTYYDPGEGINRWGDYTATAVDPSNDSDLWTIGEFAASPENTWGTYWAKVSPVQNGMLHFDGVDDQIIIPYNSNYDITGDFTIELWIQLEQSNANLIRYQSDKELGFSISYVNENPSRISFETKNKIYSSNSIPTIHGDNLCHYFAITRINNILTFYLDGYSVGSAQSSNETLATSSGNIIIGSIQQLPFKGKLDKIRLWNICQSEDYISNNLNNEIPGNTKGLIGLWNFNEPPFSQEVEDESQIGNNGYLGTYPITGDKQKPSRLSEQSCTIFPNTQLLFDGIDDKACIPYNDSYNLGIKNFTLEVVFSCGQQSFTTPTILSKRANASPYDGYIIGLYAGTKIVFQMNGINYLSPPIPNLYDNICHHISVVRNKNSLYFYLDGQALIPAINISSSNSINSTNGILIGNDFINPSPFYGTVHELRFWDVTKNSKEISDNLFTIYSNLTPNLIAYFRFKETTSQLLTDLSYLNNHGTLGLNLIPGKDDPQRNNSNCGTFNLVNLQPASFTTLVNDTIQLNTTNWVEVYPNPFNSEATIWVKNNSEELYTLQLLNMNGQLIYSNDYKITTPITLGDKLNPGLYMANIYTKNKFISIKLIKLR